MNEIKKAENILKRNANGGKYLTDKEIRIELKKSIEIGKPTERLHLMFFLISVKLSNSRNFFYNQNKYAMIKEGYIRCIKYWDKFDLNRCNKENRLCSPFSYFTQMAKNRFIEMINKHNLYKKRNYYLRVDENNQYYSIDENEFLIEQHNKNRINLKNQSREYFE